MNDIKDTQQFKDFITQVEVIEKQVVQECVKVLKYYNLQSYGGQIQLLDVNVFWPCSNYHISVDDTPLHITTTLRKQYRYEKITDLIIQLNMCIREKTLLRQLVNLPFILKEHIQQSNREYSKQISHFDKINKLISKKYTINMLNNYYKGLLK